MPIMADGVAPYAPPTTIISLINRARQKGLPSPVTRDVLMRASVSESLAQRTIQSLQLLELIDESGEFTPGFEALRRAPQDEYKPRLAALLKGVYEEVFKFADPATDSLGVVRDAFRGFIPHGQQDRMVTLFMGLCAEAGIVGEAARKPTAEHRPKVTRFKQTASRRAVAWGAVQKARNIAMHVPMMGDLPPALGGLLQSLPPAGKGWTASQRASFLRTLPAILDFCYPIQPDVEDDDVGPEPE